ncbi:MAG: hypothetical protein VZR55_00955 [Candidatus Enteromonas sp.]|nr:hypothetical protein [Candidatus Enteromonas sp.]
MKTLGKTFNKYINKNAAAVWGVIASSVAAVCGRFCPKTQNAAPADFAEDRLYGAQAEVEAPAGPIADPAGFGIPGIGGPSIPIIPPIGPTLTLPTYYYNGPNVVPYYEQPEFVKDYFRNLQTNFPTNNVGNCGYVAAAMLLSYYDTYWNPNFIPDQYNNSNLAELDSLDDKTFDSPGVNDIHEDLWVNYQPMTAPDENSPEWYKKQYQENEDAAYRDYINRMLARQDESLVALLYQKAIDIGYLKPEISPTLRTTIKSISDIANKYISDNPAIAGKVTMDYKIASSLPGITTGDQRDSLKKLAVKRIQAGQPIIFGGDLHSGNGHICIAYGYVKETDSIILHMGYKGSRYQVVSSDYFTFFNDFAYFDISSELRTIPNNKRFKVGGQTYSCHDLDSFVHKEVAVSYEDEGFHAIQCSCGKLRYEKHTFVSLSSDTKKCTACGKIISKPEWSY